MHVLEQTLATVVNLSERECKKQGIEVIDVDTNVLVEAGAKSGPLSFEDWLCLIVCRERVWSCLKRPCSSTRVPQGWGSSASRTRSDGGSGSERSCQREAGLVGGARYS